jgi:hypothetical protein
VRKGVGLGLLLLLLPAAHAQQPVGSVATSEATVTLPAGQKVSVASGRALLAGNATVTALPDRNAEVSLTRGGDVRVCRTSVLHLAESPMPGAKQPALLLALDRGAIEIKRRAAAGDVLLTPDLRFTTSAEGELDLRVRVVFNGDTCVENRGRRAPMLNVVDAFGELSYLVKPGQHLTFENGSLRAVVDRETTPCGCPPEEKQGMSLADAVLNGHPGSPAKPESANPFPLAQSEGLGPVPAPPAEPEKPGETHVQVATTLSYDPSAPSAPSASPATPATVSSPEPAVTPAAEPAKASGGPLAAIGRFFRRLFVR